MLVRVLQMRCDIEVSKILNKIIVSSLKNMFKMIQIPSLSKNMAF